MKVVILGAGLLARSLMDVFVERAPELGEGYAVMLGHEDVDVRDPHSLMELMGPQSPHQPDVIVNTVAMHALAACEADPDKAFAVNASGAGNVARMAPTVYVSTDYVFGDKGPHEEQLPGRQPRSVYGRSKFAGELETLEQGGIVVRVAGLYGHHASRKGPTFPEQVTAEHSTPMRLPIDQRFSPTYAPDAANRIADLALGMAVNEDGSPPCGQGPECGCNPTTGIFHATNQGATNWFEFGTQIAEVTRHKRVIEGYEAKDRLRPKDSSLVSTRLPEMRHWKLALAAWAEERDRRLWAGRVSPLRPDAIA